MFCGLKVGVSLSLVRRRAREQAWASSAGRAAIARGIAPTSPVLIMAVFKCMKTVSRRSTPQRTEKSLCSAVLCGVLRWLFIHMKTAVGREINSMKILLTKFH
jgi:hypothetical protein